MRSVLRSVMALILFSDVSASSVINNRDRGVLSRSSFFYKVGIATAVEKGDYVLR